MSHNSTKSYKVTIASSLGLNTFRLVQVGIIITFCLSRSTQFPFVNGLSFYCLCLQQHNNYHVDLNNFYFYIAAITISLIGRAMHNTKDNPPRRGIEPQSTAWKADNLSIRLWGFYLRNEEDGRVFKVQ